MEGGRGEAKLLWRPSRSHFGALTIYHHLRNSPKASSRSRRSLQSQTWRLSLTKMKSSLTCFAHLFIMHIVKRASSWPFQCIYAFCTGQTRLTSLRSSLILPIYAQAYVGPYFSKWTYLSS